MDTDQKRAFLAIIFSGLILFGWQYLFPTPKQPINTIKKESSQKAINKVEEKGKELPAKIKKPVLKTQDEVNEQTYTFTRNGTSIEVNNYLEVLNYKSDFAVFPFSEITGTSHPFSLKIKVNDRFESLPFELTQVTDSGFVAKNEKVNIKVLGKFISDDKFGFQITSSLPIEYRLVFRSTEKKLENNQIRQFSILSKDLERFTVGDNESAEGSVKWLGIDFNYHLFAVDFEEKKASYFATDAEGVLRSTLVKPQTNLNLSFIFTKKEYDKLLALGDNLETAVDFGVWGILAVPMLRVMQFFYSYVSNWGIAIILLTILMRLLTFPLQYKSYKSMQKMKEVQPQLTKIREKFKDDPQRLQQESMALFKRSGANPLGGCLPLLAQMPFFFAFYKVLYSSVELVGAPFILWIQDLSVKDPYFILPILMGVSFFLQQKLTPTAAADPTQQKVMMFMPIVFTFIMSSLPAGLTLYIFVSTLFGISTQMLVFKRLKAQQAN